jgi:fructose 1,6-bisphosphate aldolase/phosphatase
LKTTLTVIKADVGSIGAHIEPSPEVFLAVKEVLLAVQQQASDHGGLLRDLHFSYTGDDIAILMAHHRGVNDPEVHKLALDSFLAGTAVAKSQGLYGAGQENTEEMGPAVAELEFEERPYEPFLLFATDKTSPGAFNLPLYMAFADPMHGSGLSLGPKLSSGFKFAIKDVNRSGNDRVIELNAPEDLGQIAAFLRETDRFVVQGIYSRANGDQAVAAGTRRLHNGTGKHVGKDDPAMLVRVQDHFPATDEVLGPFTLGHDMADPPWGLHDGPPIPAAHNTNVSCSNGPPGVWCHAFCVQKGKLTPASDPFRRCLQDGVAGESPAASS